MKGWHKAFPSIYDKLNITKQMFLFLNLHVTGGFSFNLLKVIIIIIQIAY